MTAPTGGADNWTLEPISGVPTFTDEFGPGDTAVFYTARQDGFRERGTATYNGTTRLFSGRTPSKTWTTAGGVVTTAPPALNFPTTGTTYVFCALSVAELDDLDTRLDALDTDVGALDASVTALTALVGGKQASNAILTALAALVTVADRVLYFSGVNTPALATFTGAARTLTAAADAAAQRTVLGVGNTFGGTQDGQFLRWNAATNGWDPERQRHTATRRVGTPAAGTFTWNARMGFVGNPLKLTVWLEAGTSTFTLLKTGVAIPGLSAIAVTTTVQHIDVTGLVDASKWSEVDTLGYTIASPTGATGLNFGLLYEYVEQAA